MGPDITIDSAEKPPLSELRTSKMINQAPIVRYMASVRYGICERKIFS
jgi:hypothetical protein